MPVMLVARQVSVGAAAITSSSAVVSTPGPSRVPAPVDPSPSQPIVSSPVATPPAPTASSSRTQVIHVLPNVGHTTTLHHPVMLASGTASDSASVDTVSPTPSVSPSPSSSASPSPSAPEDETQTALTSSSPPPPPISSSTSVATPYPSSSHTANFLANTSPTASTSPSPSSTSSSLPFLSGVLTTNQFIGIVAGGGAFILLVLGLCIFCCCRRRRPKSHQQLSDDMMPPPMERSRRVPHRGWASASHPAEDYDAPAGPTRQVMTPVTLPEARNSVQTPEFTPPRRRHPAFSQVSRATAGSVWTDNSEVDAMAHDGSTIARTLSTVSRPNSEYDLENDPGATYQTVWRARAPGTPGTFGLPASGGTHSVENSLDLGPGVLSPSYSQAPAGFSQPASGYSTHVAGPSAYAQRQPAPRLLLDTKLTLEAGPASANTLGPASGGANPFSPADSYLERSYGPVQAAEYTRIVSPTSPGGSGLQRGPTIIRHADAGAFDDAVPREAAEGDIHLPPAYGDIYGPGPAR